MIQKIVISIIFLNVKVFTIKSVVVKGFVLLVIDINENNLSNKINKYKKIALLWKNT